MKSTKPGFWTSLPGILTGLAGVITATATLYLALKHQPDHVPLPLPTPDTAHSLPDVQQWRRIADETFSDNRAGWQIGTLPAGGFKSIELKIVDGKYRWDAETLGYFFQYFDSPFESLVDFYASVTVAFHDTDAVSTFAGLSFGSSGGAAYVFSLSPRRTWALWKSNGATTDEILGWTPVSMSMRSPTEVSVLVKDLKINLFVNSVLVSSYRDPSFTGGKVGLEVGSEDPRAFTVDFDDFIIRRKP